MGVGPQTGGGYKAGKARLKRLRLLAQWFRTATAKACRLESKFFSATSSALGSLIADTAAILKNSEYLGEDERA